MRLSNYLFIYLSSFSYCSALSWVLCAVALSMRGGFIRFPFSRIFRQVNSNKFIHIVWVHSLGSFPFFHDVLMMSSMALQRSVKKKLIEMSRECHDQKPQPTPGVSILATAESKNQVKYHNYKTNVLSSMLVNIQSHSISLHFPFVFSRTA